MATVEKKTYNGWSNYETWNVKLWLDNEEGSYRYWKDAAQECYDEAGEGVSAYARFTGREIFTRDERAAIALSERLKSEFEDANPLAGDASCWSDLLSAALSEVDWREIAESMLEDVDRKEEGEEAEEDE